MKKLLVFFEIPAADFGRAVNFYETILNVKTSVYDCENEKMACFPEEEGVCPGAISYAPGFLPSANGVLVSLNCDDMEATHALIVANGGKIVIPKTKIEAEGRGFFSTFIDSEGNTIGLYSDK